MTLFCVLILPVAYASRPLPQFRMIFPPVDTTVVTDRSRGPAKFSNKQSFILTVSDD